MRQIAVNVCKLFATPIRYVMAMAWVLVLLTTTTNAQRSLTDGHTPPGIAPGTPAGAYALSGFDNVNLFNGKLNVALPLLGVSGRGGAHHTMMLHVEQRWRIEQAPPCGSGCTPPEYAIDN